VQHESTDKPSIFSMPATYIIQVEGLLDEVWAERLAGMKLRATKRNNLPPLTTLKGRLTDQAELLGVLNSLYNLRLTLTNVKRINIQGIQK
jgi:hypothetical protein